MKIQFLGAAQEVTGSKHLITTDDGVRILLDCGMYQGKGKETDSRNRELGFQPSDIDWLILSHAHIDHSGLIPYIYREGFRGRILCTPQTRDLCQIMLADSAHIQESDVKSYNKKMQRKGRPEKAEPLYLPEDAEHCMRLFRAVRYDTDFQLDRHTTLRLTRSGHMLGAAIVNLSLRKEDGSIVRLAFTGDLGRPSARLIRHAEPFPQCDYLITESTYGDREHPAAVDAEVELCKIVHETCVERQGKLIIPSFSIGRTQEIVFSLNNLYNAHLLSNRVKVYVDSPLAVDASKIFSENIPELGADVQRTLKTDPDPFGFTTLTYIHSVEESKRLNFDPEPAIIISASGMLEAGRVKHHVANHIEDPRCTILIVGYCTPVSLGARIQQPGLKEVSIFGEIHPIRAQISKIDGFSGHADRSELLDFFRCQDAGRVRKVFVVHGEPEAAESLRNGLLDNGFHDVAIPSRGQVFEL
ncbi:MAG: MBL fold metallo-hydrolase [Paludibacteraceae bacterium]|nr:MBL fold metallo-hydrolase [Paludibacteraceae bacterium]